MSEEFINKTILISAIVFFFFAIAYFVYLKPLQNDLKYLNSEWSETNNFLETFF